MEPQVNIALLPDLEILQILHRLPLYDLVHFPQDDRRMRRLLREARRPRRELTLAIGFGSQNVGRESLLWHELQNDLRQFRGRWHEMLHETFAGEYDWFLENTRQIIINYLPNITRLNIMFDCEDILDGGVSIDNMLGLIHYYAPNLVTFRLWASGPMFIPVGGNQWYSVICQHLVGRLFAEVRRMTNLETLWLDLIERIDLRLGRPLRARGDPPIPEVPLEDLFQGGACTFPSLREFRYATTSRTTSFETIAHQLAPIPTLQCIHIAWGPQDYVLWNTLQPDIASKFYEINASMGLLRAIDPDEEEIWVWLDLEHFFGLFNSLTRVKVHLQQDGPNFLALFRSLAQVPQLQELKVDSFQPQLFTQEDAQQILVDHPNPLNVLQILVIKMHIRAETCAQIAVWPLFGDPPGQQHLDHGLVPNLACFKMWVESMAVCNRCPNARDCALNAINFVWFHWELGTLFVQCTVEWHEGENDQLVVGDQLADPQFNGLRHPQLLH